MKPPKSGSKHLENLCELRKKDPQDKTVLQKHNFFRKNEQMHRIDTGDLLPCPARIGCSEDSNSELKQT
jgi:hypothetical protein